VHGLINLDFADVRAVMREMGKAMMGTGEASGEKRALTAAEAAISNPLIDDASMKGAKGLLISITGGKDLTLYEVDEAATRIREEVDQDANIIVGATFDESLEGIIRVSVVATGIDQAVLARPVSQPDVRIAELTQKLRPDQMRADRPGFERSDRGERNEVRTASATPIAPPATGPHSSEAIENAAKAAVAAAVLPMVDDVAIRPIPPKPSLFPEQAPAPAEGQPAARSFIPPAPERPTNRPPRMPRFDELPRPAQAELRAQRGDHPQTEHAEKRKVGLLRRLAAVGLGRRDDEEEAENNGADSRHLRASPSHNRAPPVAAPPRPPMPPQRQDPVSEYAKRPAHQALDPLGRQAPAHHSEEDQLEIPAFLRRQAN
jgi:cell division protein FtsZ